MNAETGIDNEGRPYIALHPRSDAEFNTLRYMSSFLPLKWPDDTVPAGEVRVVGDRLPGSGKGG